MNTEALSESMKAKEERTHKEARAGRFLMLKDATNKRGKELRLATGTEGLSIWGDAVLQESEVSALLEELWKWLGKEQSEQTIAMIEPTKEPA